MSRWWRAYDEALNDPKLQSLGLEMIGAWFNLLCMASKNNGTIVVNDVPFALRLSKAKSAAIIARLADGGLLDRIGDDYCPHNWDGRQYQSDSSSERVKRHRAKRAAAGLVAQWTAPAKLRQAVYARDGHRCIYCGSAENLSLDHRTPEIRGGTHDLENLATACTACNGAKRDMTEDEYKNRNAPGSGNVTLLKRPQNTEQITEQNTEQKEVTAVAGLTASKYVFESGIIRLTQKHYDQWKKAYSHLDLDAELIGMTKWADERGPNWFHAVSGALTKKNREIFIRLEQSKNPPPRETEWRDGRL